MEAILNLPGRTSLAVYTRGRRVLRVIRHYGQIGYVSSKLHYCIVYVSQEQVSATVKALEALHDVRRVELSPWSTLNPTVTSLAEVGIEVDEAQGVKECE
ncbi:MAG: DUF2129 domain-containing protein [Limosilactobacillus sp.]|nr:DUF2129 domain-containing protein [Limosilactobacillus sp.]